MKHLLNTLYVTTQGAYLAREGEAIKVRIEHEDKLHVPVHTLAGIVCFGQVSVSPPCMELCAQNGVAISFLSENGRFLARVEGPVSGNVLLRREQYRRADNESASCAIAKSMLSAKIANCRNVLLRAMREDATAQKANVFGRAARRLSRMLKLMARDMPLETVKGWEGECGRTYFAAFDGLIVSQRADFMFTVRSRRPPMDNVNALLSFVYTLLAHDCRAACEGVGLDPQVGFLHAERPGRPSLALDIMEEFRPVLADRLVITLINRQQVKPQQFTRTETGGVVMNDAARKEVLVQWQNRKQEEICHPFLNEKVKIGLLPHIQAMLLARHLRGDFTGYPAFIWR